MNSHLVAVKVGVVRGTHKRVELKGLTLNQHRLKSLNTESVKCRSAVEKNRMLLYHHFESVPYLIGGALYHFSRRLDVCYRLCLNKTLHNKWFEKLKRHLLRKTALIHFKLRTYDYNRTSRIINTLAEKVLTETSLLALEHIRKGFERTVIRTGHGLAAAAVVYKRVNRLLKHTLLVADYYIRSMQLKQPLKSVVAVYNTSVKIVKVACGETSAVKLYHRTEIRRYYRNNVKYHPLRTVSGLSERLKHLKALEKTYALLSGSILKLRSQFIAGFVEIDFAQQLLYSLGAHSRLEIVLILLAHITVLLFV